jgi:Nucleotidyltransferase domain
MSTEQESEGSDIRYPVLREPYASALRESTQWILARFPVQGVVFAGSVARGTPNATSDLDLHVIVDALEQQRIQRRFVGIPAEIFVNPPVAIRRYFEREHPSGRSTTAHMFATGTVLIDRGPVIAALVSEAKRWLARPSSWATADETLARYLAASSFEDALDIIESDPATASLLLARSVDQMLSYHARRVLGSVPRAKALLEDLQAVDPNVVALVRRFVAAATPELRVTAAEALADCCLGVRGFFEWESPARAVAPE